MMLAVSRGYSYRYDCRIINRIRGSLMYWVWGRIAPKETLNGGGLSQGYSYRYDCYHQSNSWQFDVFFKYFLDNSFINQKFIRRTLPGAVKSAGHTPGHSRLGWRHDLCWTCTHSGQCPSHQRVPGARGYALLPPTPCDLAYSDTLQCSYVVHRLECSPWAAAAK